MPDEVVARLELAGDELRVLLEVDTFHRRVGREPRPVEDGKLEPLGQWELSPPGCVASHDTSVNEEETFHRADYSV
jgi:hypothetical protein